MTIQDWGAIGEAIGGVAIIISLIYVALQIHQNTQSTQAATIQSFIDGFSKPTLMLTDGEFTEVYLRGLQGLDNLEARERIQFIAWCMQVFRLWESFYYQRKTGQFDVHIWKGFLTQLSDLTSYQGAKDFWAVRMHHFSDEFQELVSQMANKANSSSIYGESLDISES